jgi:uncharacterized protein YyaL (SSP411 family)
MMQNERPAGSSAHRNRLADETSPYLLQHAENPVDWYPWGGEALERARKEDKPILLSVGYAACHWCHVMAHESFENEATAKVMNEHFINVKVDREERPDIDSIYMQAVQAMSGHGGWPMTMFLLPDGTPFYGGTYFPPEDRHGLPSFQRVLESVAAAFRDKRENISETARSIAEALRSAAHAGSDAAAPDKKSLELAYRGLAQNYDIRHSGFGTAPKFPPTMSLDFLLRHWRRTGNAYALEMALDSFRAMTRGGIYDHVGGGMARYSVDAEWLVPHFEKMLYDNALLVRLGANLWQATKDDEVRATTARTVEWVAREMTSPEKGFYSSLDADSEGHEGLFYLWTEEQIDEALGDDAALVKSHYGVTAKGNFEGRNILFVRDPAAVSASRAGISADEFNTRLERANAVLYDVRSKRIWPGRDEKILAGWNGLMLRGIALTARVFDRADWRELALANASFLRDRMLRDGRIMRSYKDGKARIPGFLEDHAAVALAFIAVYEIAFDEQWLSLARSIADAMLAAFWDAEERKIYDTAADAEQLILRPRDLSDNAIPSGSSLAAQLLVHLGDLCDVPAYREIAASITGAPGETVTKYPAAFGHLLGVIDAQVNGITEVALVGETGSPSFNMLERAVAEAYVPSMVIAGGTVGSPDIALLRDRVAIDGKPTAYVCRSYVCDAAVQSGDALTSQLENNGAGSNG